MSESSFIQESPTITPHQKFEGHTDRVTGAIHLPDGQRLMTCSRDGSLRVWNLKSGKQIGDDWRDGESGVCTMSLSPNRKRVVSGSMDGGVRLWDIDTGKVIAKWMGHTNWVVSVCWSRDGRRVVSGSYDGTARQWDVEDGETILGLIEIECVYAVVYSPDMTMVATSGRDKPIPGLMAWPYSAVKIWDAKTGKLVASLEGHIHCTVQCLAWTPDGKTLVSRSADSSFRKWNTNTWKEIIVLDGPRDAVYATAISQNGRVLASASSDKTARSRNLDNARSISYPSNFMNCVTVLSDGKLLATGCCDDHNTYICDVSTIDDDVLVDQRDKESLLVTDATPYSVRPITVACSRSPRDFVNDTLHLPIQYPSHPQSSPPYRSTLRNRFLSLFRPRHPELKVVHVTCPPRRRNPSAGEMQRPIPRLIRKNSTASSSCPSNSIVTLHSLDEKPLTTGCDGHNAYMWDTSAIDDLLLDKHDKSLLATDTAPRPVRQPIMEFPRVLRDFINDTFHLSAQHSSYPRSSPSHRSTLCSRFLSLFRARHPEPEVVDVFRARHPEPKVVDVQVNRRPQRLYVDMRNARLRGRANPEINPERSYREQLAPSQ